MDSRHAFTMVELLVVMALIAVLTALLLPAVLQSREAARRLQCANRIRQLTIAAHNYHSARTSFPPGLEQFEVSTPPRYRGNSLFTFLLPFLEQENVVIEWDYSFPLRNTNGGPAARSATVLTSLLCPSDTFEHNPTDVGGRHYGMTSYGGNGGRRSYHPEEATCDGMFHTTGPASLPQPHQRAVDMSKVVDGASHTLLFGERRHDDSNFDTFARAYWADSLAYLGRWPAIGGRQRIADVTMSALAPINYQMPWSYENRHLASPPLETSRDFQVFEDRRKAAFGSSHPGGANFALVDGSVRFIEESVTREVLQSLCTRNGQETTERRWAAMR